MAASGAGGGERRSRWLGLAGLAIALPVAILLHSGDGIPAWVARRMLSPTVIERGETHQFHGAQWRLTGPSRLKGEFLGTVLVVAEFEARVENPELLAAKGNCMIHLGDSSGRRWFPLFLPEWKVRQALATAAEKPRCGSLETMAVGRTLAMAEVFLVPDTVENPTLTVRLSSVADQEMRFR